MYITRSFDLAWNFAAIYFNVCNGTLLGSWLGGRTSSITSETGAVPEFALRKPLFWIGIAMWTSGFLGNLISDEILYNLRRPSSDGKPKPRYSIPQGFLYSAPFGGLSFPAYFCEWFEWLGFAIAACSYSPSPAFPASSFLESNASMGKAGEVLARSGILPSSTGNRLFHLGTYAAPPFLFLYAEILSRWKFLMRRIVVQC